MLLSSYDSFMKTALNPPDNYSINLMWLNRTLNPEMPFIDNSHDENTLIENLLSKAKKWKDSNPDAEVTLWYDSNFVTQEQLQATQAILDKYAKEDPTYKFALRDVRDIDIVKNNSDVFSDNIPIYFRVDLMKLIICLHSIIEDRRECAIFSDLEVGESRYGKKTPRMNKEELFNFQDMIALEYIGLLVNMSGFGMENQFFQLISKPEAIAAMKIYINANLLRARTALELNSSPNQAQTMLGSDRAGTVLTDLSETAYNALPIQLFPLIKGIIDDEIFINNHFFGRQGDSNWEKCAFDEFEKQGYMLLGNYLPRETKVKPMIIHKNTIEPSERYLELPSVEGHRIYRDVEVRRGNHHLEKVQNLVARAPHEGNRYQCRFYEMTQLDTKISPTSEFLEKYISDNFDAYLTQFHRSDDGKEFELTFCDFDLKNIHLNEMRAAFNKVAKNKNLNISFDVRNALLIKSALVLSEKDFNAVCNHYKPENIDKMLSNVQNMIQSDLNYMLTEKGDHPFMDDYLKTIMKKAESCNHNFIEYLNLSEQQKNNNQIFIQNVQEIIMQRTEKLSQQLTPLQRLQKKLREKDKEKEKENVTQKKATPQSPPPVERRVRELPKRVQIANNAQKKEPYPQYEKSRTYNPFQKVLQEKAVQKQVEPQSSPSIKRSDRQQVISKRVPSSQQQSQPHRVRRERNQNVEPKQAPAKNVEQVSFVEMQKIISKKLLELQNNFSSLSEKQERLPLKVAFKNMETYVKIESREIESYTEIEKMTEMLDRIISKVAPLQLDESMKVEIQNLKELSQEYKQTISIDAKHNRYKK